jgi:hypothetical protein
VQRRGARVEQGWWIRKIKIKRGKEMAGEIETRKISRKINDRPVHRLSLSLSLSFTRRHDAHMKFNSLPVRFLFSWQKG